MTNSATAVNSRGVLFVSVPHSVRWRKCTYSSPRIILVQHRWSDAVSHTCFKRSKGPLIARFLWPWFHLSNPVDSLSKSNQDLAGVHLQRQRPDPISTSVRKCRAKRRKWGKEPSSRISQREEAEPSRQVPGPTRTGFHVPSRTPTVDRGDLLCRKVHRYARVASFWLFSSWTFS